MKSPFLLKTEILILSIVWCLYFVFEKLLNNSINNSGVSKEYISELYSYTIANSLFVPACAISALIMYRAYLKFDK